MTPTPTATPVATPTPTPDAPAEAICQNIEPDIAIPDNEPTGITHTITLADAGTITDLDVCINASHTWPGDLYVTLTHDSGTTVVLMNRPGGGAAGCDLDNIWTYLDDSAAQTINDACPVVGDLMPSEPLSAFNGQSVSGTWTLKVVDQAAFDTGYLTGFSMTFQTGTPAPSPTPIVTPTPTATPVPTPTPTASPTPTPTVSPTSAPSPTPTPMPPAEAICQNIEPALPIPDSDPGGVTHTVNLSDSGTIVDLDVCINASHTWPGDLYVTLTHDSGTTVVLMNRPGGGAAGCGLDNVWTYLDDSAAQTVNDACPVVGDLMPYEPLSAFNGQSVSGEWTLKVVDQLAFDTGYLTGFSMTFQTGTPAPSPTPTVTPTPTATPAPTPTPTATPIPSVTPTPTATPTPTPVVSPTSAPSPTPTPVPPSCPTNPLSIPDNDPGGVDRALGLGGTDTIQDLNVCITITHNWPGNLKVTLTRETTVPPETTTVVLMDRPGILNPSYQAGCPNTNPGYPLGTPMSVAILFDDEAVNSVTDTCPLVGPLRPQDALSAFDNKTRGATWTLRVYDLVAGDTGTLTGFALDFTLNPTPTPTP